MELCWWSLLTDAYKHMSCYLLISVAVAVGSVLFAWLYETAPLKQFYKNVKNPLVKCTDNAAAGFTDTSEEDAGWGEVEANRLDARTLAATIAAEMTAEQRELEKETERQQLAAILKLLREQEDTYQVSSIEQLEEQLHLYR